MAENHKLSEDGKTITDSKTGLMWDRSHMPRMNWHDATEAAKAANDSNRHGHADWRLPTRADLEGLIDLRPKEGARCDQAAFPDCPASRFWTCETYKPDPAGAWIVFFADGDTVASCKDSDGFVRLVRSGH